MKKHLVKGSIEAKKYMAKLRAKRTVGAVKKKAVKKAAPKKSSVHKDTKSHNVNIRVVSGIGSLPVALTGKFWGVPFKVHNQYDIYGAVSAIIEDTSNGKLIVEITSRTPVSGQIEAFKNYIALIAGIDQYSNIKELEKGSKQFISNLYQEVKKFNAGKTSTSAAKKGINIKPKKVTVKKSVHSGKTTKTKLKEDLKSEGLKLTHGYTLAARKIGAISLDNFKKAQSDLYKWEQVLKFVEKEKLTANKALKPSILMDIKRIKQAIKEQKTHLKELKKTL
jgi:hypothetical protein